MSITEKLTLLYLVGLIAFAVLGGVLYRTIAKERRVEFQISLLLQLLGTVAFGAVVTYSLYAIQHSQQAEEKLRQDAKTAADNKARVLGFIYLRFNRAKWSRPSFRSESNPIEK
jgi:CHASE3 domain sensor protein